MRKTVKAIQLSTKISNKLLHADSASCRGFCKKRKNKSIGRINAQSTVEHLLTLADVRVGGDRPWDIEVHNPDLFTRVLVGGSLALGESYMDGWWDCEALDQFFDRVLSVGLDAQVKKDVIIEETLLKAITVEYQEPKMVTDEKTDYELERMKWEDGTSSPVQYMMKMNPGMSADEAETEIEKHKTESAKAGTGKRTLGAFGKKTEKEVVTTTPAPPEED